MRRMQAIRSSNYYAIKRAERTIHHSCVPFSITYTKTHIYMLPNTQNYDPIICLLPSAAYIAARRPRPPKGSLANICAICIERAPHLAERQRRLGRCRNSSSGPSAAEGLVARNTYGIPIVHAAVWMCFMTSRWVYTWEEQMLRLGGGLCVDALVVAHQLFQLFRWSMCGAWHEKHPYKPEGIQ